MVVFLTSSSQTTSPSRNKKLCKSVNSFSSFVFIFTSTQILFVQVVRTSVTARVDVWRVLVCARKGGRAMRARLANAELVSSATVTSADSVSVELASKVPTARKWPPVLTSTIARHLKMASVFERTCVGVRLASSDKIVLSFQLARTSQTAPTTVSASTTTRAVATWVSRGRSVTSSVAKRSTSVAVTASVLVLTSAFVKEGGWEAAVLKQTVATATSAPVSALALHRMCVSVTTDIPEMTVPSSLPVPNSTIAVEEDCVCLTSRTVHNHSYAGLSCAVVFKTGTSAYKI